MFSILKFIGYILLIIFLMNVLKFVVFLYKNLAHKKSNVDYKNKADSSGKRKSEKSNVIELNKDQYHIE